MPSSPPPEPPEETLPVIDELAYFDELTARRPDLMTSGCYDTLTAKPKYRDGILHNSDSIAAIRARTYGADEKAHDVRWTAALQASEQSYCAEHGSPGGCGVICKATCDVCSTPVTSARPMTADTPFAPSGYPLCDFVGYKVGPQHRTASRIRDWKVFFEFKDDRIDVLTPDAYLAFTAALAHDGFHGDSKITMSAGRVRYQYNDIIVHSESPDDARIAERIGMRMFGSALASRARGLDIESPKSPYELLDWHHYLCAEGKASIPAEGLAFVTGK